GWAGRVTVAARGFAAHQLGLDFFGMAGRFEEFLGRPVAAEAADILVGPCDLDRLLVPSGRVAPDVAEAFEFRLEGPAESVVGVAGGAMPPLGVAVLLVGLPPRLPVPLAPARDA